ncbi:MAG: TRAP transporter large permease subunit [Ostreibacterium sp.]
MIGLFIAVYLVATALPSQISLFGQTYLLEQITLPLFLCAGLVLMFYLMSASRIIQALLPPLLLILAVLGSIFSGVSSPTEAGSIGAVGAILLASTRIYAERNNNGRLNWVSMLPLFAAILSMLLLFVAQFNGAFGGVICIVLAVAVTISIIYLFRVGIMHQVNVSTLHVSAMVFSILIAAQLLSLTFRVFQGEEVIYHFINNLPGGITTAILVVMACVFLLGFILDFIEITYIIIPIVDPVLFAMGVDPIWFAVLFTINIQTSFLTPPFGFALFYLRGVAPATVETTDIYKGVLPFVAIQILVLALVFFWQDLAVWLPEHLETLNKVRRLEYSH